jgi:dTMP kinase
MRGRFITFEGVEGVGKSTQVARAAEHLRARGVEPLLTREPGGTPLAEKLRALILEHGHGPVAPTAEVLMLFAARASHVTEVIRPAIAEGRVVLCDRFTDTSEAYQGGGRGVSAAWIRELARIAHPRLAPDLTLVFDAPAEVALARLSGRGAALDRIEGEDAAFFERVRRTYHAIAQREPARVHLVDATRSADAVAADVARLLDAVIPAGRA